MPFPNWIGSHKRLWTKERVVSALALVIAEVKGPLPRSDAAYNRIKKGRFDWPTTGRILEYFHSMARAWLAAGALADRVSLFNIEWSEEEKEYLCDHAGISTLEDIARYLGRTRGGVRGQLWKMGIASRHNQGFLSAAELAKEYGCPYHRVRTLLNDGVIKARYDSRRNRWEVDPDDITPTVASLLEAPKQTHKNWPTDVGDYYQRYGIRRSGEKVAALA
ncbi:hypothetical protein ES703_59617 [subsurface metagenome]